MSHTTSVDFAPAGVLRAAAWPLEKLDVFGSAELAQQARQIEPTAKPKDETKDLDWQQYLTQYDTVFAQERQQLWQQTAHDAAFVKALRLSNPIVFQKIQSSPASAWQQPRKKSIRRLENTLYRYLARAVGRTTPNSLWAGVSLVHFADTTAVTTTKARYRFTPDLRPFQTLLRLLAHQPIYREQAMWQVNPTLLATTDEQWTFWARAASGQVAQQGLGADTDLHHFLKALVRQEQGTLQTLAAVSPGKPNWDPATRLEVLNVLIDNGLLLGGLDLPEQFADPWQALQVAAALLKGEHQQLWAQLVSHLETLGQTLETDFETLTPDALDHHLKTAHQLIENLFQAFGIPLESVADTIPETVLRCDLQLPLQVQLAQAEQQVLQQALRDYQVTWLQGLNPAGVLRQILRDRIAKHFHDGVPLGNCVPTLIKSLTLPQDTSVVTSLPPLAKRQKVWDHLIAQTAAKVSLKPDKAFFHQGTAAPLGCFYVFPEADFSCLIKGVSDSPATAFARFGPLLDPASHLTGWLTQKIQQLARRCRLNITTLRSPLESNPNVLAQPSVTSTSLGIWSRTSPSPKSPNLKGTYLQSDPISGQLFLHSPSVSEPIVTLSFSSANVGQQDPIATALMYTGFQESPLNLPTASAPTPTEQTQIGYSPRVELSPTTPSPETLTSLPVATLRLRRTVLSGETLAQLAQASGPERYAHWQQLAHRYSWPVRVTVQVDSEPPLLLQRDSPLALEALFKSVKKDTHWVIVEEAIAPWLTDAAGQHYSAEFALPFARRHHSWSAREAAHIPGASDISSSDLETTEIEMQETDTLALPESSRLAAIV